jgi:glyceraldehyde 3-phosphate dehydrogenase
MDSDPVRRQGPERDNAEGEVVLGASPPARRLLPGGGLQTRLRSLNRYRSLDRLDAEFDGEAFVAIRVGINGFGRIGRNFFRAHLQRGGDFEVVAANDLGDAEMMAYLLKHDSVLGTLDEDVAAGDGKITVGSQELQLLTERNPGSLPWGDLGVDVVIESTGFFTDRDGAAKHLDGGAKKVIISAPAKGPDVTIVLGVNEGDYDPEAHEVISNASCTTNCVAPLAKVLHDELTIEQGFMTTIHAYTNDQRVLDLPHEDMRRARAAAINLIPTSTGAARAIGLVMPDLQGKVDGMSMRAPVPTGSIVDLVVRVGRETTKEEVNELFRSKADSGPFEGILRYTDEPLVSTDIQHSSYSSTFDSDLTMVNGSLVKVFGWYDNEWGYSCRLVDLVAKVGATLPAAVSA